MGAFSIWHWIIVLIVVLILFGGKGKLSSIMGDFGKGLKNFKDLILIMFIINLFKIIMEYLLQLQVST